MVDKLLEYEFLTKREDLELPSFAFCSDIFEKISVTGLRFFCFHCNYKSSLHDAIPLNYGKCF